MSGMLPTMSNDTEILMNHLVHQNRGGKVWSRISPTSSNPQQHKNLTIKLLNDEPSGLTAT